jgi:hypothetical protein
VSPPEPPRRPSTEYGVRTRTQPVPGGQLTGPTPKPPNSGAQFEHAVPPGIDKALAGFLEGIIVEQVAVLASSLEAAGKVKVESKALAEISGKLYKAEETIVHKDKQVRRTKSLAVTLGAALGTTLAVFVTAWSAYRDTRQVAETAAVEVVEAKAVPVAIAATANDVRVTAVEARQSKLELEVGSIKQSTDRILELLEPAAEVHVPQGRKRPR